MKSNDKKMKQKLISKRKSIETKLQQLKQGEMIQESVVTPITKHLKNIESNLQSSEQKSNNQSQKTVKVKIMLITTI